MPFNMFPYSNLHNLNLDWVLTTLKAMVATIEQAQSTISSYESRLEAAETGLAQITPAAAGAVRHDVSQSLDAANRRRAATNIHAVSYDPQLLSAAEQAQARTNIGAISSGDIPPTADAVLYTAQQLTEAQQGQARSNIAAASQSDMSTVQSGLQRTVRWDVQQLTDVQKQQARTNIGAISSGDIPPAASAVLYTAQQLTDAQKQQARENIQAEYEQLHVLINNLSEGVYTTSANFDDVVWAAAHNIPIWIYMTPYGESDTYIGVARLTNNAQGYESIGATLTLQRVAAESLISETWYNVSWLDGDPAPVLTVTTYQGRMVPSTTSDDAGKVLAVNSLGRPVWEAPSGPLVVMFLGTTAESDAVCDKTWAQIEAALTAGRPITAVYDTGRKKNTLNVAIWSGGLQGTYIDISDPTNPGDSYTRISCIIDRSNRVACEFTEA